MTTIVSTLTFAQPITTAQGVQNQLLYENTGAAFATITAHVGGGQPSATVIGYKNTIVTGSTSSGTDSIRFFGVGGEPVPPGGTDGMIINVSGNPVALFPHLGHHIFLDGVDLGLNVSMTLQNNTRLNWLTDTSANWYIIGTGNTDILVTRSTAVDTTLLIGDSYLGVTNTTSVRTISLPSVSSIQQGKTFTIKDQSGAAGLPNEIRVAPNGVDTIDGINTYKSIINPYTSLSLICNNSAWWTI